jgi:hypothetical protein
MMLMLFDVFPIETKNSCADGGSYASLAWSMKGSEFRIVGVFLLFLFLGDLT